MPFSSACMYRLLKGAGPIPWDETLATRPAFSLRSFRDFVKATDANGGSNCPMEKRLGSTFNDLRNRAASSKDWNGDGDFEENTGFADCADEPVCQEVDLLSSVSLINSSITSTSRELPRRPGIRFQCQWRWKGRKDDENGVLGTLAAGNSGKNTHVSRGRTAGGSRCSAAEVLVQLHHTILGCFVGICNQGQAHNLQRELRQVTKTQSLFSKSHSFFQNAPTMPVAPVASLPYRR
jgi:hypothetical protein